MKKKIVINSRFVTFDEKRPVFEGSMSWEGDRITGFYPETPNDLSGYDEVIDGKDKVYMPGLINTHGHAGMSLLRGYADDYPLQTWLEQLIWPIEARFTNEDVKWGSLLSIAEMLKGGTTTFVDMYTHMDEVARAVQQSGIRAVLSRGVIGLGSREEAMDKLAESASFAKEWNGAAGGRITTMLAPHAPYTCPPWYIKEIVSSAEKLGLPIHIHMSETSREVEENAAQYGERPVKHLADLGVFNLPTLVAHAVHLTDEEIDILKQYDVKISHNPGSNLKLASGIARVPALLRKGVTVSLGTDSAASNNNLDMFEEMRLAALIHKGVTGDPLAVPAQTALSMATKEGAASVWLDSLGVLKSGCKADFISVRTDRPHLHPMNSVISHLVYSANSADVADVYVDGECLVRNRTLLTLDEEQIQFEANRRIRLLTQS